MWRFSPAYMGCWSSVQLVQDYGGKFLQAAFIEALYMHQTFGIVHYDCVVQRVTRNAILEPTGCRPNPEYHKLLALFLILS